LAGEALGESLDGDHETAGVGDSSPITIDASWWSFSSMIGGWPLSGMAAASSSTGMGTIGSCDSSVSCDSSSGMAAAGRGERSDRRYSCSE